MNNIALRGTSAVALCLVASMGLIACYSSEPVDEAALERLATLGFTPSTVGQTDNIIVVDDDIVFERDALLAGEYRPPANPGLHLVEKGYRYKSGVVSAVNARHIKLSWASGTREPNAKIKAAFVAAAAAWSAIPGSALRIHEQNTGPAITVHMVNADLWPPAGLQDCATSSACASFPKSGKPGLAIYVANRPLNLGCLSWKESLLGAVARHELGHAIGLAHPNEADSVHVDGTQECTSSERACLKDPGPRYTTIMSSIVRGNCTAVLPRLTKDDYATAAAIY